MDERTTLHRETCPYCGGKGTVLDRSEAGKVLSAARYRAGISQVGMAKRLGISKSYLNCLERETRSWPADLVARYETELRNVAVALAEAVS